MPSAASGEAELGASRDDPVGEWAGRFGEPEVVVAAEIDASFGRPGVGNLVCPEKFSSGSKLRYFYPTCSKLKKRTTQKKLPK